MKAVKNINFKEPIVKLKILDDGTLLVVDSKTVVRFLNLNTLDVLSGFKANIPHLRYKNSVVDFSNNGKYFVVISADCSESIVYNTYTKKAITRMSRHQGDVSCVAIEPKNRYSFSCGEDGKIYATNIGSKSIAFTLPVHVDSVNDIAFSDNAQWIATSSYDKKIHIFNMTTMGRKHRLIGHADAVDKLKFLSDNRLFSIDKKNNGIIWDYFRGKVIARLDVVHDDVLHVTLSGDGKFLFLGTQLGYIIVFELETYRLLSKKYIKLSSPITALSFNDKNNELIIGTKKGDLFFYDIYDGKEHIKGLLKNKEYNKIQKYVDKNPLLAYTKAYQLVNTLWESTLKKAVLFLEKDDKESAIKLLQYFKNIPSKNAIMQKVIIEYEDFYKFVNLAKNNKLALAYSLVNKHPMYRDSSLYRDLELRWKKAFLLAQKYAINPKNAYMAKEVLTPYRGISEKTKLIKDLLTQSEVYKRFRISIGQKDFRAAFELVKQHSFLKEFADYENLMRYADNLYIHAQKQLDRHDTHAAIKTLRILLDFPNFIEEAKELIKKVEDTQKFYNAIEENNMALAHNLLSTSQELQDSKDGKKLLQDWNDTLAKANVFSLDADVDKLNKVMEKYLTINSKSKALANIYGWCYMVQLENAVRESKEQVVIENGIKNYILYFGLQEQIENLFKIFKHRYPKTKLNLSAQTKGSIEMWRTSMIVKSILD